MERLRSINLRIGFAAAILLAIFAFNWTTDRTPPPVFEPEDYPTELALKPFTINQPRQQELPPATVLRPKDLIVAVPDLELGLLPALLPSDPVQPSAGEPGNINMPTEPVLPKAPVLPPDEPTDEPFLIITEEMPRFPGCEGKDLNKAAMQQCATEQLLKFVYDNIRYPAIARDAGVEGTVYVRFIVEKDGSVSNISVMRDIGAGCGEETIRVVKKMPKWRPGKQRGMPVRVQFNLPIKFKLT